MQYIAVVIIVIVIGQVNSVKDPTIQFGIDPMIKSADTNSSYMFLVFDDSTTKSLVTA